MCLLAQQFRVMWNIHVNIFAIEPNGAYRCDNKES